MDPKIVRLALLSATVVGLIGVIWIGVKFAAAFQSTPGYQFTQARRRWETNSIQHYRMVASYYGNWSQCYYDIEVWQDRIVRFFSFSCLSSAESKTFTVDSLFKYFERYTTQRVCSANGCYCEGSYVVRATYDEALGFPQRITTEFSRNWINDLLHGKIGVQECLRADPVVERFDRIDVTILP